MYEKQKIVDKILKSYSKKRRNVLKSMPYASVVLGKIKDVHIGIPPELVPQAEFLLALIFLSAVAYKIVDYVTQKYL